MTIAGVLLDIDGVLLVSSEPLPGAAGAVERLRRSGVPVRFVTNTTSVPAAGIAEALVQAGIELGGGDLVTAGIATATYLREHHPGARCLLLNDGSSDGVSETWSRFSAAVGGTGAISANWMIRAATWSSTR